VGWSCWRTVEHVCADFAHYAAQIIGQPRDHYVKYGGLLAAAVRTAGPHCLGWHPHSYFTPAGFAAIGAAGPASAFETLLIHTGRAGRPQHQPPPSWSYAAAAALPLSGKP
jgi:hypothetical protein